MSHMVPEQKFGGDVKRDMSGRPCPIIWPVQFENRYAQSANKNGIDLHRLKMREKILGVKVLI